MRDRVAVSQCVSVVFALAPRPTPLSLLFFFNDTATTEIYTLSLHDALPISIAKVRPFLKSRQNADGGFGDGASSIHDTAHASMAMGAAGFGSEIDLSAAQRFVAENQRMDGSWQGSV